jgi:hypothetical protein
MTTKAAAFATLTSDATKIAEQFWRGAVWGRGQLDKHLPRAHTLSEDLRSKEDRIESVKRIRYLIESSRDALMREAGTYILGYLERYRVRSDTADPFKLTYWFGIALSNKAGEIDGLDKRAVLLTTVELLDILSDAHCKKRMPEDMRSKMDISIAEGKYIEEFGSHGMYHSFKVLAKAYG